METVTTTLDTIPSARYMDQQLCKQLFALVDSNEDERVTGEEAKELTDMFNLPRSDLKQVWALADINKEGYLGYKQFVVAMELIYLAQNGHELTANLRNTIDSETIQFPVKEWLDKLIAKTNDSASVESEIQGSSPVQSSPTSSNWFNPKPSSNKELFSEVTSIADGLKILYEEKLKPLEVAYNFHDFVSHPLTNGDFDAKPMVMLLGQYSTGKTTFIKHLLGCEYPGSHIGPEPTTDCFVCLMSGPEERSIPGNTVAIQADMPFSGLSNFEGAFLSKFQCTQMPHPLLENITFIDTPGVLSGEKQRTQRNYDYIGVTKWLAAKCDLILILFDPHKADLSDEFKLVMSSLHGQDDKIRVVLNKADQVDTEKLMRAYGALTWSLGKILNTAELRRVFIGSFDDKPIIEDTTAGPLGKKFFEKEQNDLLSILKDVPKEGSDRKISEFLKRAKAAKTHAYIISTLYRETPFMIRKGIAQQQRPTYNLEGVFAKVQKEYNVPAGDLPSIAQFRYVLKDYNFGKLEKLKPTMIEAVDVMINHDIPELIKKFKNPYA